MKEFKASPENVKFLGRYAIIEDTAWISFSASGLEFIYTDSDFCQFVLAGDGLTDLPEEEMHHPRFAVYVNNVLVLDTMLHKKEDSFGVELTEKSGTIRLIKLSESSDSTLGIKSIYLNDAAQVKPSAPKKFKMEIIGDSITCGYGVDGTDKDTYSTSLENATKSYAYKTVTKLDADYSMVSFSGYGIITGYTETDNRILAQILPQYYESIGNSYRKILDKYEIKDIKWDFSNYTPDLIVINLGTNDDSYCRDLTDRQDFFCSEYVKFLKKVRSLNPNAQILCVLGIMGRRLYPYVEKAASVYSEESGDKKIKTLEFEEQGPLRVVDGHPTEESHEKASLVLSEFIKSNYLN